MQGTTPYKIALHPGSHTILLTLDGYKDYTTTVNLQAGNPVAFDAQLQKVITAAAVRENIAAANTVVAQHVTLRTIAPARRQYDCLSFRSGMPDTGRSRGEVCTRVVLHGRICMRV